MHPDEFERRMRALECYHELRVPPGAWIILRLDGRRFSRFTESRFEKPFDPRFHQLMVKTTKAALTDLQGIYGYTESEEISLLFPPAWDLFDRELEKMVSVSASIAAVTFSMACGEAVQFDCRACVAADAGLVVDYFQWRQADATRCALNGWCYWTLRKEGHNARRASAELHAQSIAFKNELLFQSGINFNNVPSWQRRGTGLYWETYDKQGFNPKSRQAVTVQRRRIKVDEDLPMKAEYGRLLRTLLREAQKRSQVDGGLAAHT